MKTRKKPEADLKVFLARIFSLNDIVISLVCRLMVPKMFRSDWKVVKCVFKSRRIQRHTLLLTEILTMNYTRTITSDCFFFLFASLSIAISINCSPKTVRKSNWHMMKLFLLL